MRELVFEDKEKTPGVVEFLEKLDALQMQYNKSIVPAGPAPLAVRCGYESVIGTPELKEVEKLRAQPKPLGKPRTAAPVRKPVEKPKGKK